MKYLLATFAILAMLSAPASAMDTETTLELMRSQDDLIEVHFDMIKTLTGMIEDLQAKVDRLQKICREDAIKNNVFLRTC